MRKIYKICLVLLLFACFLRADNTEDFALSLENSFDFLKIQNAKSNQGIFDYDGVIEGSIEAKAINKLFFKFGIDSNLSENLNFKYSYNIKNSLSTAFGRSNIEGLFVVLNEPYKIWLGDRSLFSLISRSNSSYHDLDLEFSDMNVTFGDANLSIHGLKVTLSVNDKSLNQILLNLDDLNYNSLSFDSIHINSTYEPPLDISLNAFNKPSLFVLSIGEILDGLDQNFTIQNLTATNRNLEFFDINKTKFNATFIPTDDNKSDFNNSLKVLNSIQFDKILHKNNKISDENNSSDCKFCIADFCFELLN